MTAQEQEKEQAKGAVFFAAVLTIAAGAAGLAFAGTVVGLAYMLKGEPSEREQLARQREADRQARYEGALAWLNEDEARRARERALLREWYAADPETRGDRPTGAGETFGRVAARLWCRTLVGCVRFARGWKAGREEARQRRAAGLDGWWRVGESTDDAPNPGAGEPPAPAPENPTPGGNPTPPEPASQPRRKNSAGDVIDAEIVEDGAPKPPPPPPPPQPGWDVAPTAAGDNAPTDLNVDGYAGRIDNLRDEVTATLNNRNTDPSPPRSALN